MKNSSKIKIIGLVVLILYLTVIFLSVYVAGLSILDATKDNPLINNGESFFYGLISNIGIFIWILSSSLNFYAYLVNKKNKIQNIFLIGAIHSAFLFIADLLDLQNSFQNIVYFLLITSSLFVVFLGTKFQLIKNKLIFLFFSFSFFSAAMIIDISQYNSFPIPYLYTAFVEELFEFLGGFYYIFYWMEVIIKINKQKKLINTT